MTKRQINLKGLIALVAILLLTIGILAAGLSNVAAISNGLIKATVFLPDNEKGYYRGVRFDRSAIMPELTFNGHSYFGQWYKVYRPEINDAVMGPVEAFDPLGFTDARAGRSFVKIGVGTLTKPDTLPYNFERDYKLTNPGVWHIKTADNLVDFEHTLKDSAYPYNYRKRIEFVKRKPLLVISHTLKNTGTRAIRTAVFDHNFFVMDGQYTGPGFVITFPDKLIETLAGKEDYVKFDDNQLVFIKELDHKNVSFKDLTNGKGSKYDIKIENRNTGAAVRITADRPVAKMVFWSALTTLCPEPYINVDAAPGKSFTWKITYEFYTCPVIK